MDKACINAKVDFGLNVSILGGFLESEMMVFGWQSEASEASYQLVLLTLFLAFLLIYPSGHLWYCNKQNRTEQKRKEKKVLLQNDQSLVLV